VQLDPRPAIAHPDIEVIQGGSLDANSHFAGAGIGDRVIGDILQIFYGTMFGQQNGFHEGEAFL
jgi:hypothetical protein